MPTLSIIVPTRNRMEQLAMLLESLAGQDCDDFEVIVSDNSDEPSSKDLVSSFNKCNFRYIRPKCILSMCDHWDFALSYAAGDFASILIDKYMLFPYAVGDILKAIYDNCELDIVSWLYEGVYPEDSSCMEGMKEHLVSYSPEYISADPLLFNPLDELQRRRINSSYHRSEHKSLYFRAKICSGAYSKSLLGKILTNYGRIFPPYAPDFTSCTLALTLAAKCLDINKVLGQFGGYDGNGASVSSDFACLQSFLVENDCLKLAEYLPIPHLISSIDNWVGHDLYVDHGSASMPEYQDFGWLNLFKHAKIWVSSMKFTHKKYKQEQIELLLDAEKKFYAINYTSFQIPFGIYWFKLKKTIKSFPYVYQIYSHFRFNRNNHAVIVDRLSAFRLGSQFHQSSKTWVDYKKQFID